MMQRTIINQQQQARKTKGQMVVVTTTKNMFLLACYILPMIMMMMSDSTTPTIHVVSASVFMPYTTTTRSPTTASSLVVQHQQQHQRGIASQQSLHHLRLAIRRNKLSSSSSNTDVALMAMAIPGYGVAEQVIVGGFGNFLSIYNLVITARILLSWFPQAASVGALQPVYAITDPYLNLFRNIIPPLFGLDFSPILAFLLLNVLTNATAAVGYEIPSSHKTNSGFHPTYVHPLLLKTQHPSVSSSSSSSFGPLQQQQRQRFVAVASVVGN